MSEKTFNRMRSEDAMAAERPADVRHCAAAFRALSPGPQLPPAMLALLVLTVAIGLPVDRFGGIPGQLAVSVWTWALFVTLLGRINQQLRVPLMLCLVIAACGEFCLSLLWQLYSYRLNNIPFFVPPGHVLLFTLGLTLAPRVPQWAMLLVVSVSAGYAATAFMTSTDTISVALAVLFLMCMAFGSNRRLYAAMFIMSLPMELYGTWIGNWVWAPGVPGLPLSSLNPPLCVGALYCALDLCVLNLARLLPRLRQPAAGAARTAAPAEAVT
jgi:hypothetical protein